MIMKKDHEIKLSKEETEFYINIFKKHENILKENNFCYAITNEKLKIINFVEAELK